MSADYLYAHGNPSSDCELVPQHSIECMNNGPFHRLLHLPLLPAGYTSVSTHVIAEVKLGIDSTNANTNDVDFYITLSDGHNATGFAITDRSNYNLQSAQPCHHAEGAAGSLWTNRGIFSNGPNINVNNPVPQQFDFFFSTKQKWGSCVTATAYEGSYTTSGHYTRELQANNGLYVDIYSDNEQEEYTFKFIMVDIKWTSQDLCY